MILKYITFGLFVSMMVCLFIGIANPKLDPPKANHIYNLESRIGFNEDHMELIELLQNAKDGDTITINIAGYGGQVITILNVVNAIRDSKAKVIGRVTSGAYSAHALLSCSVAELDFRPGAFLMFHSVQSNGGAMPYSELDPGTQHSIDSLLYDSCSHILTYQQMYDTVNNDYEYYVYPNTTGGGYTYKEVRNQEKQEKL